MTNIFYGHALVVNGLFLLNLESNEKLMTLSKRAKLGLQVQSVVARVNFSHKGNSWLISNSRGIVEKALVVLLPATCKTISYSCVSKSTEWLSITRCEFKLN
jgi:hypothetical protein